MSPLLTSFPFAAGGLPKATVTSTTGSPTIDTTSRPGKTIYKFTGSGTITIGTAGVCEILCVGSGSAGSGGNAAGEWGGGGGAGQVLSTGTTGFLSTGSNTVTVGAGVAVSGRNPQDTGIISSVGNYKALGGGGGSGSQGATITNAAQLLSGASWNSGGAGRASTYSGVGSESVALTAAFTYAGFKGGNASTGSGGGGAGNGAVGVAGSGTAGGAGGAGTASSITGTSVTYGGGGGGGGTTAGAAGAGGGSAGNSAVGGTANTGGGGGGQATTGAGPGAGGSGFVIIVIG